MLPHSQHHDSPLAWTFAVPEHGEPYDCLVIPVQFPDARLTVQPIRHMLNSFGRAWQ